MTIPSRTEIERLVARFEPFENAAAAYLIVGDDIKLLLTILRERLDPWRPMSEAPKDGSVILLAHTIGVHAAYWSQCHKATGGSKRYPWVFLDSTNGLNGMNDTDGNCPPYAWMPLPAPPEDAP